MSYDSLRFLSRCSRLFLMLPCSSSPFPAISYKVPVPSSGTAVATLMQTPAQCKRMGGRTPRSRRRSRRRRRRHAHSFAILRFRPVVAAAVVGDLLLLLLMAPVPEETNGLNFAACAVKMNRPPPSRFPLSAASFAPASCLPPFLTRLFLLLLPRL